jgi:hypothetical protein
MIAQINQKNEKKVLFLDDDEDDHSSVSSSNDDELQTLEEVSSDRVSEN